MRLFLLQKTVQLFQEIIEKRQKLIALKNKVIQAHNRRDECEKAERAAPTCECLLCFI